jgi:uncharacterized coiled-coil DUF342 family protein
MVSEVFAGLSAIKTAFDLAKGLKDIDDATRRNTAVIELQEKILAAREAQSTLLERISELEKKVASFEAWDADKKRYELKSLAPGVFAYRLKEAMAEVAKKFMISVQHVTIVEKSPLSNDETGRESI